MWQQAYNEDPQLRHRTRAFKQYRTIDWPREKIIENSQYLNALKSDNRPSTSDTLSSAMSFLNEISTMKLIKSRIWTGVQVWFIITIVGIVIGSIAAWLSLLTEYLNELKLNWSSFAIVNFIIYMAFSVLFGVFASYSCLKFAPNACGSGISEVKTIVSGFNRPSFLNFPTLILKASMLPFTIASGLSVGKEGPSVHYASCVGNVLSRSIIPWFNDSSIQLSDIVTASAGSGVAVAFGSPIGGVLFALEEISSGLKLATVWKTFYMSLIAIGTLQLWDPFGTGQIVMFSVRYEIDWKWGEVFWFILLGVFGGVYGRIISYWNIKYVKFRQSSIKNGVLEIALLTLVTSVLSYWNIFMRFEMTNVMEMLFDPCIDTEKKQYCLTNDASLFKWVYLITLLLYALIVRMVLVIVSYGAKVPCGIFVPSMTIGATFGKILGLLVGEVVDHQVNSGIYAFLGAGAALSGITGLTVSVVVIMYELTGAIKYIVPSMIVIVTVRVVSVLCCNSEGIADQMIKFNGIPYIDLKEEHNMDGVIGDVMVRQVYCIDVDIEELDYERILEFGKKEYPVIKNGALVGVVDRESIKELRCDYVSVEIDADTSTVFDIFTQLGPRNVYVTKNGQLVGLLSRKDMIRYEIYSKFEPQDNDNLEWLASLYTSIREHLNPF